MPLLKWGNWKLKGERKRKSCPIRTHLQVNLYSAMRFYWIRLDRKMYPHTRANGAWEPRHHTILSRVQLSTRHGFIKFPTKTVSKCHWSWVPQIWNTPEAIFLQKPFYRFILNFTFWGEAVLVPMRISPNHLYIPWNILTEKLFKADWFL